MNKMMLLAVLGTAFWAGCATTQKPAYDTLICHRGESHDAPENTLPAYRMAVDRGLASIATSISRRTSGSSRSMMAIWRVPRTVRTRRSARRQAGRRRSPR